MNQPVEALPRNNAPAAAFQPRVETPSFAHAEDLLDESLMLTFPASDAISPGFIT